MLYNVDLRILIATINTISEELMSHCKTCFPLDRKSTQLRDTYVDLLKFSNFAGVPYAVANFHYRRRFLADFRYSWSVPLIHDYPFVEEEVLLSSRVQNAMESLKMNHNENNAIEVLHKRSIMFLTEIRAKLSKWICKCCAYILYKVFRRLMEELLVCPHEMEQLQIAEKTGVPLVYLPLHRSHLDYLLITWCNWHYGLKLPHIASGDNLNLCGLGWLLRATGAFFIRRRLHPNDERGNDLLYRSILHSYIEHILSKSMPIEFFLEGTRSRFGKALTPKNGLISNVVQAVQHGFIKDCFLVPVSYTYDAVVEGVFINELTGVPKVRESVFGVLRGIFTGFKRSKQCGVVRMHYGRPILLTDYLLTIATPLTKQSAPPVRMTKLPTSFSYRELVPWHRSHSETIDDRTMIRAIGFHVVYEAQMMCSISPLSIVSCLILAKWRLGVSKKLFEKDCEWLCEEILADGGDVVGYQSRNTPGSVIAEYAFKKLKECVTSDDNYVSPIINHSSFIQLAYNKNSIICRFSIKSVVAIALTSRMPNKCMDLNDIVDDTVFLCDWLQFEFLFCSPCQNLRESIVKVISDWNSSIQGLITLEDENFSTGDLPGRRKLSVRDTKSQGQLLFFSNLVRPFLQSLYILCQFLSESSTHVVDDQGTIRKLCQYSLSGKFQIPFPPLLEAINSDSFKNSMRILREKRLLIQDESNHIVKTKQIRELMITLEEILTIPDNE